MNASKLITAAIFSAFLKCPTKAHLMSIGEPAPSTHLADIEARTLSMYKAAAKPRSPIGAEVAQLLDFNALWRSREHDAITHHVDCDTAVYDFALPLYRPKAPQRQNLPPSDTFVPILFVPWNKPGLSDRLVVCFGALALSQTTGSSRRNRKGHLRRRAPPKNRQDRGPCHPDASDHRRNQRNLLQLRAAPTSPE